MTAGPPPRIKFVAWVVQHPYRLLAVILTISLIFAGVGISTGLRKNENGDLFMEGKQYDLQDFRSRRRDALDETMKRLQVMLHE